MEQFRLGVSRQCHFAGVVGVLAQDDKESQLRVVSARNRLSKGMRRRKAVSDWHTALGEVCHRTSSPRICG